MKPILPFFILLALAAGSVLAQEIDPDADDSASASGLESTADEPGEADDEESAADETGEADDEESADKPDSEHDDSGISDEFPEPTSQEDTEEPDAETEEALEETDVDELFAEITGSGNDPEISGQDHEALADVAEEEEIPVESEPVPPQPGLAVRVERVQGATPVDPSEVQLSAPFPAKLLAEVPEGWRIEKSDRAPAFTREVELSPGSNITLSVQPHILVPEADGVQVFAVNEPGYRADLGYQQDATVGAILATSIRQLDDDTRQLGEAIDQLQQLLVSLPRPEPALQEDQPASETKR